MSEPSLPFGGVMRELARARRMLSRGDLEGAHHVLLETRYRAPEALRGLEEFDVLDGVVNGKRTNNDATTVHLSGGGAEKVSGGGGALSYDPASDRKLQGLRRGITEIQQKIEIQQQETTAIVQDTEQLENDARQHRLAIVEREAKHQEHLLDAQKRHRVIKRRDRRAQIAILKLQVRHVHMGHDRGCVDRPVAQRQLRE